MDGYNPLREESFGERSTLSPMEVQLACPVPRVPHARERLTHADHLSASNVTDKRANHAVPASPVSRYERRLSPSATAPIPTPSIEDEAVEPQAPHAVERPSRHGKAWHSPYSWCRRDVTHLPKLKAPTQYPREMRLPPMDVTFAQSVGKNMPRAASPRKITSMMITKETLSSSATPTLRSPRRQRDERDERDQKDSRV